MTASQSAVVGVWIGRVRYALGIEMRSAMLALFCGQTAALLRSGQSMPTALQGASAHTDYELHEIARALMPPMRGGISLSNAILPFQSRFPALFLPVLEVGELSGTLDSAFDRLSAAFAGDSEFERRYRAHVFNPWIVVAILLVLSLVSTVPNMGLAAALVVMVSSIWHIGLYCLLLRLASVWLYRVPLIRLGVDNIKLALPYVGTVARSMATVRWVRSFVTMYNAGVPVSYALDVSSRSVLNGYYEQALKKAVDKTRYGQKLSESLSKTQLLPPHLIAIIASGEESGSVGLLLESYIPTLQEDALERGTHAFIMSTISLQIILAALLYGAGANI